MSQPSLINKIIGKSGIEYTFEWYDSNTFSHLEIDRIKQCYAVAYDIDQNNTIVIVHNKKKDTWGLIGGSVETDEHPDDTLKREILEESGYEIVKFQLLGYQKMIDSRDESFVYQLRYIAYVKKKFEFTKDSDPANTVDKIALINPSEYRKYFDWGNIGERIIELAKHELNKE